MSANSDFIGMLGALATVFAAEGRPGGDSAAAALNQVAACPFDLPAAHRPDIVDMAAPALRDGAHPAAEAILLALPLIDWHHSGLHNGRIRAEIALAMATAELIGPNGMIFHPNVRVGLFMQIAHLDYVTRTHPAKKPLSCWAGPAIGPATGPGRNDERPARLYFTPPGHHIPASPKTSHWSPRGAGPEKLPLMATRLLAKALPEPKNTARIRGESVHNRKESC